MIGLERGTYVDVDGLRTFYVQVGRGFPLVLIHGGAPGACSVVNWQLNLEPLAAAGFAVYAFDQPGFGATANPTDYSLEYRVAHARAFLDAMDLPAYHVIGNSQGAYVAARLALEDPRVGRLVLVSSGTLAPPGSEQAQARAREHADELAGYTPSLENMRAMTMKTLFRQELVTDELVQLRYAMSDGKNLEAARSRGDAPRPRPIHEQLASLPVKSLIFAGKNDRGVALERSLLLFQCIPGAELHVFDQCGHWVQWDQAARFNRLVADFLGAGAAP